MFAPIIAVINKSIKVSNEDVIYMVKACQYQLSEHFSEFWGAITWFVIFYPDESLVPARAYKMLILDNPDMADALGYHTENVDKPYGRVFVAPILNSGGAILYESKNPQGITVSSVLSHEILELRADTYANYWADGPQASYAIEVCDPVQENSYTVMINGKTVAVSNFVTPKWFDPQSSKEQYDYMNILNNPFAISNGGYAIVRTDGKGTEQQIFSQVVPPLWRMELKRKVGSRSLKRIVEKPVVKKKWWKYLI